MSASASSFLVLVLMFLVLVGHICELPVSAALAAQIHQDAHHSPDHHAGDHHADDSRVSCDAVVGVQPNPCAHSDRGLDVDARSGPVVDQAPRRVVATALPEPAGVPRRPPLFLLHASLLI